MDISRFASKAGIAIALISSSLTAAPCLAQDLAADMVLDEAESLAVDAGIYAAQYGVTKEEAMRRLRAMLEGTEDAITQANLEGADFAGVYFDNSAAEFAIVIRSRKAGDAKSTLTRPGRSGMTRGAQQRAARASERAQLRARFSITADDVAAAEEILSKPQRYTLEKRGGAKQSRGELQSTLTNASGQLVKIPGYQTSFVDDRTGEIVIMVDATEKMAASQAAASVLSVPHRIELVPGGFVDVTLRGGLFTTIPTQRWCMTAFGAKRTSDGKTGIVTAGHCASASTISMTSSDGTSVNLTQGTTLNNTTTGDLMFLSGTPAGSGQFRFDGTGSFRTVTGFRARSSTSAGNGTMTTASTIAGSFVCHVGQETLGSSNMIQSCGEVISTAGNRGTGGTTGGNYVIVRNTQSGAGTVRTSGTGTLKCYQGDSGGPWFAGTIAFGVMSACQWEGGTLNGTALYSMYTSVSEFNLIGVSLLVP